MTKVVGDSMTHGDLPWRLGSEIVIYRGEDGMTFKQFQDLRVGDLVKPYHIGYVKTMGKMVSWSRSTAKID